MMKTIAILMIMATFLAGSFIGVLDPREVNWSWFVPVLLFGTVGLWLARKAHHQETRAGGKLAGNIEIMTNSLDNILSRLTLMCKNKEELPTYEARFEIDRLFREELNNFAEARESMIHIFGMQNYADVMSNFAAGERYINRIWSASTDGYVDEVNLYLDRALNQFTEAHEHFNQLLAQHQDQITIHQGA
jgi:hypothetical protein